MAKYVLVEFDDDAEADKLVEFIGDGIVIPAPQEGGAWQYLKPRIRAVFKKPTKFCDCSMGKNAKSFTRGKKYGWWVHAACGKPTRGWGRGDHWFLSLGRNLLPITNEAPEYRGDGVFARHYSECPNCQTNLISEIGHGQAAVYC